MYRLFLKWLCGIGLCFLALIAAGRVHAQQATTTTEALAGSVRASGGTPLPGATVRMENTGTHQRWITWTDEEGKFSFPNLGPGEYRMTCESLGFAPASLDFTFHATTPPPPPIELTLQTLSLAEVLAIQTASGKSSISTQKAGEDAPPDASVKSAPDKSVPESGAKSVRQSNAESRSAPDRAIRGAAIPAGISNAMRQGLGGFQQVSLEGQDPNSGPGSAGNTSSAGNQGALGAASSSDSYLLNGSVGLSANAAGRPMIISFGGMGAGGAPGLNLDLAPAAGQKRVMVFGGGDGGVRGGRGARGGGGGAVMFFVQRMRAQVNRIHYGFTDTYENSAFDARPYSLTQANPPKISHYSNHAGFNAGGPLKIPHIYDGSDKTFFFANYSFIHDQTPVDTFATVPTGDERKGNFCAVVPQLYDPRSNPNGPRQPLGCDLSSNLNLDQAALGLLNFIPKPNLPGTTDNFHLQAVTPETTNFLNLHILHTISNRFSLNGGYSFSSSNEDMFGNFPTLAGKISIRDQSVNLSFVQNWSQRFTNDSSVNWSRNRIRQLSDNSFVNNIAGALGISDVSTSPINFGVPSIRFTSFSGLDDPLPSLTRDQTLSFNDTLTYALPKHTFTAGGEIRRIQQNTQADPIPRGEFNFTGLMTSQLDTSGQPVPGEGGVDFADFLLGVPQTTQEQFGSTNTYFRNWGFIAFAQDDWHVNPRFTLEGGIRYEAATPPIDLFDKLANIDVNSTFTAAQVVVPGQTGPFSGSLPQSLIRGDYNNWAPRVGFAWKPLAKQPIVVRGGYSIFYDVSVFSQLTAALANQPPWAQAQFNVTSAAQFLTLENGFPAQTQSTSALITNTRAVNPNYRAPGAQIWDLAVERQLPHGWVLNLTYTGTNGTNLDLLEAPNRLLNPGGVPGSDSERQIANAGGFTYELSGATSSYNALQVRVQKHFSRGLLFYALYTFGKSLDDASAIGGGSPVLVQNDSDFRSDWGRSAFDQRHALRTFATWELPFGPRQRWARHGWQERIFGSYRINAFATATSGLPFTALGPPSGNTGSGGGTSQRANQIADACLSSDERTPLHFFNTAAFTAPVPGSFGNAARGTICGPPSFNVSGGISRSFIFGRDRQRRMTLSWNVRNLTNTPSFQGLSTIVGSSTFGEVLGARPMRSMSGSLRVNF